MVEAESEGRGLPAEAVREGAGPTGPAVRGGAKAAECVLHRARCCFVVAIS